jgi:hypothetical protein
VFGPPGRNEASFIRFAISIDNRNLDPVHKSDSVDPYLAVVETIVRPLDSWSVEDARRVLKGDSVPANVDEVLLRIPGESHASLYIVSMFFEALAV